MQNSLGHITKRDTVIRVILHHIHMFLLHGNGGNSVRCDYQRVRILAGGNRILLPRKEATIFYQNIIDTKGIFVLCVSCSVVSNSLRPYGPKPTLKIQS